LVDIPVHILRARHGCTRLATKQDHHGIAFRWDEAKEENIFDSAVVAFESGFAELMLWVEADFFVTRSDEVVDDMGTR
jgi:hypothetical protein